MTDLIGKTALVTGASRGIGASTARALAEAGASVALCARTTTQTEATAAEIRDAGGKAIALSCDVSHYTEVAAAVVACKEAFGALDILVNNAGVIEPVSSLAESDPAAWVQASNINYHGVYHGLRAALPIMQEQNSGTIINISSGAATHPLEGWSHYCSSKAAVLSLTQCAELETPDTIRVVGLSPGTVATDMQVAIKASGVNPVSTLDWSDHIPPDWPARAIVWLCSENAAEFRGQDVSLRDEAIRKRVGLI